MTLLKQNQTTTKTHDENEVNELTLAQIQWDPKNTAVSADTKPRIKLSTDFNRKLKAANKIKKNTKKDNWNQTCKEHVERLVKKRRISRYKRSRWNKLYLGSTERRS